MKPCFFIFGFGYTAEFLVPELVAMGFTIIGTTRNEHKIRDHQSAECKLIDFNEETIQAHLGQATHILISTPPIELIGDPVLAQYYKYIGANASHIQWLGYLSSTGVYGDYKGAWIDETSACLTQGRQGQSRLRAEIAWMDCAKEFGLPLHIFRLAGIYGPHRNALVRIAAGKQYSISKPGHFFSRIHVEDIARVLIASIKAPNPLSIYNVADDEPSSAQEVDAYAASLLNLPALPFIAFDDVTLNPMEKEFYANNRRVSNLKIKQELGIALQYPSYREGLLQLKALHL
jgi:nucleoside-diphosphate-sugar epimerase